MQVLGISVSPTLGPTPCSLRTVARRQRCLRWISEILKFRVGRCNVQSFLALVMSCFSDQRKKRKRKRKKEQSERGLDSEEGGRCRRCQEYHNNIRCLMEKKHYLVRDQV